MEQNPDQLKLHLYKAMIWHTQAGSVGIRAIVLATSIDDARRKLEEEHGVGTVYDLHHQEEAGKPR